MFSDFMLVKGIKICLRPFRKAAPEPQVRTSSAYFAAAHNLTCQGMDDQSDRRHQRNVYAQFSEAIDVDDWMVIIYGSEQGGQPAPPTPSSRPRAIPPQPVLLPPRGDDASPFPEVRERPGHPQEGAEAEPAYEETFEEQDRAPLAPIRPKYNLKKLLAKLLKLVEAGERSEELRLLAGLHGCLWQTLVMDFQNLLRKVGMPADVVDLASEAVQGCVVCRKFVRLPNRPQMRTGGSANFGDTLQIDILQTAVAQTAITEDREQEPYRTRPHQLNVGEWVAGTSTVEFFREVQGYCDFIEMRERTPACACFCFYRYKIESIGTSNARGDTFTASWRSASTDRRTECPGNGRGLENKKREGPDTRTVVLSPEKNKQQVNMMREDLAFLENLCQDHVKNFVIRLDYPGSWKDNLDFMVKETRAFLLRRHEQERKKLPFLFNLTYKTSGPA
eukprot:s279_g10.t1